MRRYDNITTLEKIVSCAFFVKMKRLLRFARESTEFAPQSVGRLLPFANCESQQSSPEVDWISTLDFCMPFLAACKWRIRNVRECNVASQGRANHKVDFHCTYCPREGLLHVGTISGDCWQSVGSRVRRLGTNFCLVTMRSQ